MVAVLFRLVLIASLVLNGSGRAMAHVAGASAAPRVAVHDATDHAPKARPPCHMAQPAASPDATARIAEHGDGAHRHADPDAACCGSGACQCACLQQAITIALQFDTRLLRAADLTGRPIPAHAPPLLPSVMRPPIG